VPSIEFVTSFSFDTLGIVHGYFKGFKLGDSAFNSLDNSMIVSNFSSFIVLRTAPLGSIGRTWQGGLKETIGYI